jgi:hypothetical protein
MQGKYVGSVDIARGAIIITYGNRAHSNIAGRTLILTPYVAANRDVFWLCGYSTPGQNLNAKPLGADSGFSTTVDDQYLPTACQG